MPAIPEHNKTGSGSSSATGAAQSPERDRSHVSAPLETEGQFRALAETAASAIFIYRDDSFVYVNQACEQLTGFTRGELLTMSLWNLIHPDHREMVRERALVRKVAIEVGPRYEFKILTKSGEERWVHFGSSPIQYNGKVAGIGTAFDITERKRASEELLVQKAYFEQLFEFAPEAILIEDNDGRILMANREFGRMFDYDPAAIVGAALDDLIASGDTRDEATALTRHICAGGRFSIETVRHRSDGSLVDVAIVASPIEVGGGQIAAYVMYRDITQRKRAEQALIESEAKFRVVAETAATAIFIHDGTRFFYLNRAMEDMTGYSRDELMQSSPYIVVHPDFRSLLESRAAARLSGQEVPSRYELKVLTRAGDERWWEFSASRIQLNGQARILATAFDITERKRSEQLQSALYQIAHQTSQAEDLSSFYAAIHSIVSELIYAKNFYIALYDEDTEILSWPYFVDEEDPAPPEPRGMLRGLTEYVIRTGKPLLADPAKFEELVASGDVESLGAPSIDWLGVPLKIGDKSFGVLVAQSYTPNIRFGKTEQEILTFVSQHVATAIQHKRDEERLRISESRYRALFERAAYGMFSSTADGEIRDANPAMVAMLGYDSVEELRKLNLQRDVYVAAEDRTRILREYARDKETFETRWKRKDGKVINVRLTGNAVLNAENETDYYEVIAEDITDRRLLEEQLRHAQKMEAVGRLAGGVAHDFNNLLTVIKGYSELILDHLMQADPMRLQVEEIRKAADRAASLTRQLLAFSRRQVLSPKVLDLNSVISNMDRLLKRLLGEDVELHLLLAPQLARVKTDPGQLEQVIMNLAVNARDAMPEGGRVIIETAGVTLDSRTSSHAHPSEPGNYVMLAVTDTGHGMPEEVRVRVFEPFFTTKERGTGLGLSTVYGIVKQSGGSVFVESELGRGSTFRVYLPCVDDPPEPQPKEPQSGVHRGNETILLVEDEDGVRTLVRQMLERSGYTVIETRSAGEAFLICEREQSPIHLLLTDVVLNQISGNELAKRVAPVRPEMKVLYISGYTEDAIVKHGVLEPGIAFLQKPFTAEDLARRVREVLDSD